MTWLWLLPILVVAIPAPFVAFSGYFVGAG